VPKGYRTVIKLQLGKVGAYVNALCTQSFKTLLLATCEEVITCSIWNDFLDVCAFLQTLRVVQLIIVWSEEESADIRQISCSFANLS
jgi:hypothetical protein